MPPQAPTSSFIPPDTPPAQPPIVQAPPPAASPPPSAQVVKYAGFWVRFAAGLVDGIILNILIRSIFYFAVITSLFFTTALLITWVYLVGTTLVWQRTLGGMAVGLRVEKTNKEKAGAGSILLRETIGKLLSTITLFFGFFMSGWTAKKQGLHDKMTNMVVVEVNPAKSKKGWIIGIPFLALAFIISSIIHGIFASAYNEVKSQVAIDVSQANEVVDLVAKAITYHNEHANSYRGFALTGVLECSATPVAHIAPDGQSIAIFLAHCQVAGTIRPNEYFCLANNANIPLEAQQREPVIVSESVEQSGATSCTQ